MIDKSLAWMIDESLPRCRQGLDDLPRKRRGALEIRV